MLQPSARHEALGVQAAADDQRGNEDAPDDGRAEHIGNGD
jgi:hypothetical protein